MSTSDAVVQCGNESPPEPRPFHSQHSEELSRYAEGFKRRLGIALSEAFPDVFLHPGDGCGYVLRPPIEGEGMSTSTTTEMSWPRPGDSHPTFTRTFSITDQEILYGRIDMAEVAREQYFIFATSIAGQTRSLIDRNVEFPSGFRGSPFVILLTAENGGTLRYSIACDIRHNADSRCQEYHFTATYEGYSPPPQSEQRNMVTPQGERITIDRRLLQAATETAEAALRDSGLIDSGVTADYLVAHTLNSFFPQQQSENAAPPPPGQIVVPPRPKRAILRQKD